MHTTVKFAKVRPTAKIPTKRVKETVEKLRSN